MWGLPPGERSNIANGLHVCIQTILRASRRRSTVPRPWVATRGRTNFEKQEPVSFYGVALDVTFHKRIEERLDRRVEARTRELEEANRLLHSQIERR
jgi:hypothetical protein